MRHPGLVHALTAGVQALSGMCRSFLGPFKPRKCVISDASPDGSHRSTLVASAQELLYAMDGEPTSSTLLLEYMDAQVQACGCGSTWLAVLAGLLLEAAVELLEHGCPLTTVLQCVDKAIELCIQVAHECAIPLTDLASIQDCKSRSTLDKHMQDVASKIALHSTSQTSIPPLPSTVPEITSHHGSIAPTPAMVPRPLPWTPTALPRIAMLHEQRVSVQAHTDGDDGGKGDDLDWFFEGEPRNEGGQGQGLQGGGMVVLYGNKPGQVQSMSPTYQVPQLQWQYETTNSETAAFLCYHAAPQAVPSTPFSHLTLTQLRLILYTSLALRRGDIEIIQLSTAALVLCLNQLTSPDKQPTATDQTAQPAEQLSQLCSKIAWNRHVAVHELHGPSIAMSKVFPGVCIPMSDMDAHVLLHGIMPLVMEHARMVDVDQGTMHHTSAPTPRPATQAVCAGFLEGGLGLLAPPNLLPQLNLHHHNQLRAKLAGRVSQAAEAQAETKSTESVGPAPLPAWVQLSQQHLQITHVSVVQHSNSNSSKSEEALLQEAAEQVTAALKPTGIQLVLLAGPLPPRLADAVLSLGGPCLLGSISTATITALAAACEVTPVAGLAGLATGTDGMVNGMAHVALQVVVAGRRRRVGRGEDVLTYERGQGPGQAGEEFLIIQPACTAAVHGHNRSYDSGCLVHNNQGQRWNGTSETVEAGCNAPAVGVLLTASTQVELAAAAEQLPCGFRRLQSCLACGRALPGGGVYELLCARALRHANQQAARTVAGADDLTPDVKGGVSCAALSVGLAADHAAWQAQAYHRLSQCFELLVQVLLQNEGQGYMECDGRVKATEKLVEHLLGGQGRHERRSEGKLKNGTEIPSLSMEDVCALQHALHGDQACVVDKHVNLRCEGPSVAISQWASKPSIQLYIAQDSGIEGFQAGRVGIARGVAQDDELGKKQEIVLADDWLARVQALRACGALVKQVLGAHMHISNSV